MNLLTIKEIKQDIDIRNSLTKDRLSLIQMTDI